MRNDVFISHSSKDANIAGLICSSLESKGIKCWYAPRDIAPGNDWAESINSAIKNSSVLILVFSENSNNSVQVAKELNLAVNNKMLIVPFKIDSSQPTGSMEYYLSDTHWLDATAGNIHDDIAALEKVVVSALPHMGANYTQTTDNTFEDSFDLQSAPNQAPASYNQQETAPQKKSKFNPAIAAIAAVVLVAAVLAIGYLLPKNNQSDGQWDCFVEKYSVKDNFIVGGEESIKKAKLSDITDDFNLVHNAEIVNDNIDNTLNLDELREFGVTIKSETKPTAIHYTCGNNGPVGSYSIDSVPYADTTSSIEISTQPRSKDGYSAGDDYRVRIVVVYEDKTGENAYDVEKIYFDKNVSVAK